MPSTSAHTIQHTPGPWRVQGTGIWGGHADGLERLIAGLWTHYVGQQQTEANARLIAAAPELLEALKALLSPDAEGDVDMAIAAIRKAEGREP